MTTKPKAKKFRIRRNAPLTEAAPGEAPATPGNSTPPDEKPSMDFSGPTEDGFGSEPYPTSAAKAASGGKDVGSIDIEAIKKEGLSGRQLRMARRIALRNGLAPTSDLDAVRQLRQKGIDPFKNAGMLELVVPDAGKAQGEAVNLPKTVDKKSDDLPSTEVLTEAARAREIYKIQRDIARRRRRKSLLLVARLACFIFLPTLIVGYYYYNIATPLYATKSEFLIQQASPSNGGGGGGLFGGGAMGASQDSMTVQSYLQSRDAMLRLDKDVGFKARFSAPDIDPLLRLDQNASNEQAYRLYSKLVKIGFDPTEGIVKMEVSADTPATSEQYSESLIKYAEEQVDKLTQRLRGNQMIDARESYLDAENKMLDAQRNVLELQERLGVIDAASETGLVMGQVTNFETQIREKELQLQQLLDNASPNQARVDGVKGDISRLQNLVTELRAQLTQNNSETTSLARMSGELKMAELDLQTRQAMMTQSLQQLENARIEANRQVRYLSLGVNPVAPDEATYPRAFENTLVALLIFSGIYLMMSLTASILREQVLA